MRVLVLGAGGRFGSRLVSAVVSYHHTVIALARDQHKLESILPSALISKLIVETGSAEDIPLLERLLEDHQVDILFNCAGSPSGNLAQGAQVRIPQITAASLKACANVSEKRGRVIRGWWLCGVAVMDDPHRPGHVIHER